MQGEAELMVQQQGGAGAWCGHLQLGRHEVPINLALELLARNVIQQAYPNSWRSPLGTLAVHCLKIEAGGCEIAGITWRPDCRAMWINGSIPIFPASFRMILRIILGEYA